jgi:phage shock protein A
MGDVGMAIQRAEDKTAQMQARAGAIDELMASGALDDAVGGSNRDDIQSELDMMSASSDVERELSRLKGEITAGAPKQLEGGANGNSQAAPPTPQSQGQGQGQGQGAQYAPPPPEQVQGTQPTQQAQPAGIPGSDLPGEPQDREGS